MRRGKIRLEERNREGEEERREGEESEREREDEVAGALTSFQSRSKGRTSVRGPVVTLLGKYLNLHLHMKMSLNLIAIVIIIIIIIIINY
jgi:hypothetical protein